MARKTSKSETTPVDRNTADQDLPEITLPCKCLVMGNRVSPFLSAVFTKGVSVLEKPLRSQYIPDEQGGLVLVSAIDRYVQEQLCKAVNAGLYDSDYGYLFILQDTPIEGQHLKPLSDVITELAENQVDCAVLSLSDIIGAETPISKETVMTANSVWFRDLTSLREFLRGWCDVEYHPVLPNVPKTSEYYTPPIVLPRPFSSRILPFNVVVAGFTYESMRDTCRDLCKLEINYDTLLLNTPYKDVLKFTAAVSDGEAQADTPEDASMNPELDYDISVYDDVAANTLVLFAGTRVNNSQFRAVEYQIQCNQDNQTDGIFFSETPDKRYYTFYGSKYQRPVDKHSSAFYTKSGNTQSSKCIYVPMFEPLDMFAKYQDSVYLDVYKPPVFGTHPEVIRTGKGKRVHIPVLSVAVNATCNLQCNFCCHLCNLQSKRRWQPDANSILHFVSQWSTKLLPDCIQIVGGEPLLHPEIKDIIKAVQQIFSFVPIYVCTNGLLVDDNLLRWCKDNDVVLQISEHSKPFFYDDNKVLELIADGYPVYVKPAQDSLEPVHLLDYEWANSCPYSAYYRSGIPCEFRQYNTVVFDKLYSCSMTAFRVLAQQDGVLPPSWDIITNYQPADIQDTLSVINEYLQRGAAADCAACVEKGNKMGCGCKNKHIVSTPVNYQKAVTAVQSEIQPETKKTAIQQSDVFSAHNLVSVSNPALVASMFGLPLEEVEARQAELEQEKQTKAVAVDVSAPTQKVSSIHKPKPIFLRQVYLNKLLQTKAQVNSLSKKASQQDAVEQEGDDE